METRRKKREEKSDFNNKKVKERFKEPDKESVEPCVRVAQD
jgi:hypothetical protein